MKRTSFDCFGQTLNLEPQPGKKQDLFLQTRTAAATKYTDDVIKKYHCQYWK